METLLLKNGTSEPKVLVQTVMLSLGTLIEKHPIAFYELVMKCRKSDHRFFGNTSAVLQDFGLIESAELIHDSIRNIVLSAATGDGLQMSLDSPVN